MRHPNLIQVNDLLLPIRTLYLKKANNTIFLVGDLGMKKHRIIHVKRPRNNVSSVATTVEYAGRVASHVYNTEVDWSGRTMTGM